MAEKVKETQYEFQIEELAEFLENNAERFKDTNIMLHSSGDGKIKANEVSTVLLTSSQKETAQMLKNGRLSVGTFYIEKGCLVKQRKRWIQPQ